MNWVNIHTDTLRSELFLNSEPTERATWLCLLAWCCSQENGGVIADCRDWKDRKWQQLCGVLKSEVEACENLIEWEGDSLMLHFYPLQKESEVRLKREAGAKGGRAKTKAKSEAAKAREQQKAEQTTSKAQAELKQTTSKSTTEGKRREWKGKNTPSKSGAPISEDAEEFAKWFRTLLPPDRDTTEADLRNWAKTYDDLVRLDDRAPDEIRAICQWARNDEFWASNFLSACKLRQKDKARTKYYDVFKARMTHEQTNHHRQGANSRNADTANKDIKRGSRDNSGDVFAGIDMGQLK